MSSSILPSFIGTLKSTRMKTRFPAMSTSLIVRLFIIYGLSKQCSFGRKTDASISVFTFTSSRRIVINRPFSIWKGSIRFPTFRKSLYEIVTQLLAKLASIPVCTSKPSATVAPVLDSDLDHMHLSSAAVENPEVRSRRG